MQGVGSGRWQTGWPLFPRVRITRFVRLQKVGGAGYTQRPAVEHKGVDHRRSHTAVAE